MIDPTIRGIQVNKHELKISQYADDTTVVVRDLDYNLDYINLDLDYSNLEKTLNTWQRRNLTLYGKINIVKTLGIS